MPDNIPYNKKTLKQSDQYSQEHPNTSLEDAKSGFFGALKQLMGKGDDQDQGPGTAPTSHFQDTPHQQANAGMTNMAPAPMANEQYGVQMPMGGTDYQALKQKALNGGQMSDQEWDMIQKQDSAAKQVQGDMDQDDYDAKKAALMKMSQ